jgi:hypothetical protein
MALAFKKATKSQAKLRAAFFGPSGSGKTFTALRVATGMGGTIAVIDTERGSASKYADRFEFDVLDLGDKSISGYVEAISAAGKAGYANLVIDSLSHGWQDLLTEIDQLAKQKYRGNTWSAWSDGTPKQRRLVDAILNYPGHVIATMRSKTEWSEEKDERTGKTKPVRIGLAPEQGKGIEYEFDLLGEIGVDHLMTVIKDRTGKFQDKVIDKPGEEFGEALVAWLSEGAPMAPRVAPPVEHHPSWEMDKGRFFVALGKVSVKYDDCADWCEANGRPRPSQMDDMKRRALIDFLGTDAGRDSVARFVEATTKPPAAK